jgi:hypothetical protein
MAVTVKAALLPSGDKVTFPMDFIFSISVTVTGCLLCPEALKVMNKVIQTKSLCMPGILGDECTNSATFL